jgi:hypothetical protein
LAETLPGGAGVAQLSREDAEAHERGIERVLSGMNAEDREQAIARVLGGGQHHPNARARAIWGRIVRRVDSLQEKLGIELLRGELITLDGDVYLVGGFLDGGDKVELWRETPATHAPNGFEDRPMAAPGLKSYRYRGRYGWIMIGAKDDRDALREASRSTGERTSREHLETWNGNEYVPVPARSLRRNAGPDEINVANPSDAEEGTRLWRFWFGQVGPTIVYVWEGRLGRSEVPEGRRGRRGGPDADRSHDAEARHASRQLRVGLRRGDGPARVRVCAAGVANGGGLTP